MKAIRLYGPKDLRVDSVPEPGTPGRGQVLIRVSSVGICGSDLHNYLDARIGDTVIEAPVILGHEFSGIIEAIGPAALDGNFKPLHVGQRVAVDPATPCHQCENCEHGHPNLCRKLHFHGLFPDDGALVEKMITASRGCFPIPDALSDAAGALLEPLGVAIHAVDLGKLRLASSVAVIGCGPIGLLITRLAHLSGAHPIFAFDKFGWRAEKAKQWGATQSWALGNETAPSIVADKTIGRGVDVAFEAAWADKTVNQAAQMTRLGGRVVLVGIPDDNKLQMDHSVARRKGLTIMMSRRMKHTYPRAIQLATDYHEKILLDDLISHRFSLEQTPEAFAMNVKYQDNVNKIVVDISTHRGV